MKLREGLLTALLVRCVEDRGWCWGDGEVEITGGGGHKPGYIQSQSSDSWFTMFGVFSEPLIIQIIHCQTMYQSNRLCNSPSSFLQPTIMYVVSLAEDNV